MTKQKKKTIFIVLFSLLFVAAFLFVGVNLLPQRTEANISHPRPIYHYFENANALANITFEGEIGTVVYIADGGKIYSYNLNTNEVNNEFSTLGEISYLETAFVNALLRFFVIETTASLENTLAAYDANGNRLAFDFASHSGEGFSSLAIYANLIYAANGSEILVFDALSLAFRRTLTLPNAIEILGFSSSNARLYIAYLMAGHNINITSINISADGQEDIRNRSATMFGGTARSFDNIHFFPNLNLLYLWHGGVVSEIPVEFGDPVEGTRREISTYREVKAITANNEAIFYLYDINTLTRQTISLTGERILLASRSGEIDGFYDTPQNSIAAAGRVFTADRGNNRIVVNSSDGYRYIENIISPLAVAARYDIMAVAYSTDRIAVYDISNRHTEVHRFTFRFPHRFITDLAICSGGGLYILTDNGRLWRVNDLGGGNTLDEVNINGEVVQIAMQLNSANTFVAEQTSTITNIALLTSSGTEIVMPNIDNFVDFAVDEDGAIYILSFNGTGFIITRYELDMAGSGFTEVGSITNDNMPVGADNLYANSRLSITVSGVDFRENSFDNSSIAFRDIIVTNTNRHRVFRICVDSAFGVESDFVYFVQDGGLTSGTLFQFDADRRIIYRLNGEGSVQLFMTNNDAFPVYRGGRQVEVSAHKMVIVPNGLCEVSDFTLVVIDNLSFEGPPLVGFIRTSKICEALEYRSPSEFRATAIDEQTKIYMLPTVGFEAYFTVEQGTALTLVDFTYFLNEAGQPFYGYFDNRHIYPENIFPQLNNDWRWYRVTIEKEGYTYEGFVLFNSAEVFAPFDRENRSFYTNAIVIEAWFDEADLAQLFDIDLDGNLVLDAYGNPMPHTNLQQIRHGEAVMIVGNFDSSVNYHRIRFLAEFGYLDAFIRTPNLEYEGIDTLTIVALSIAGLAVVLGGAAMGRYFYVKKRTYPKQPVDKFI